MRTFTLEIVKPKHAEDFEDYCAEIYSVVFEDPTPKRNGRTGQSQGGVDIFVEPRVGKRKGIQCKRYYETKVTEKVIADEVVAADKAGWSIGELIVATTAASDSKLVKYAQDLTDARAESGKFKVSIEFWDDICNHIKRHAILQKKYSPNSPGGVYDDIRTSSEKTHSTVVEIGPLVSDAAANLAVGRLLLGDALACLKICEEAGVFGESALKLAAPRVYAYHELGDLKKVVEVGAPHLKDMHISAQMMVGESAAILGMPELVRDIAESNAVATDSDAAKTAQALMWIPSR